MNFCHKICVAIYVIEIFKNFKVYSTQSETKHRHFIVILCLEGFRLYSFKLLFILLNIGNILYFNDVNRLQEKLQVLNQVKVRRNEMIFVEFGFVE